MNHFGNIMLFLAGLAYVATFWAALLELKSAKYAGSDTSKVLPSSD